VRTFISLPAVALRYREAGTDTLCCCAEEEEEAMVSLADTAVTDGSIVGWLVGWLVG
jgi:hypothetical protein